MKCKAGGEINLYQSCVSHCHGVAELLMSSSCGQERRGERGGAEEQEQHLDTIHSKVQATPGLVGS